MGNSRSEDAGSGCDDEKDYIEELVCFLTGNDITKRLDILWGYSYAECQPYIEGRQRDVLFREAVIGFLCGSGEDTTETEYCKTCKVVAKRSGKPLDCASCSKDIKEVRPDVK